jgi:hypothetical protein
VGEPGVVIVQQEGQGAVAPGRLENRGRDAAPQQARLWGATSLAHHLGGHTSGRLDGGGQGDPRAVQEVAPGGGTRFLRDDAGRRRGGELGKDRRRAHDAFYQTLSR